MKLNRHAYQNDFLKFYYIQNFPNQVKKGRSTQCRSGIAARECSRLLGTQDLYINGKE